MNLRAIPDGWLSLATLHVVAKREIVLNGIDIMTFPGPVLPDDPPGRWRVMTQERYSGRSTRFVPTENEAVHSSESVLVVTDTVSGKTLLGGFVTAARWNGRMTMRCKPDGTVVGSTVGIDGGDLVCKPGETIELETIIHLTGDDPHDLLDRYADMVRDYAKPDILPRSPVTWCSWYPYRLGVDHEKMIATARIAAERLKPLGMETLVVDLGWEKGWLPSIFAENDQFPYGLRGVADELEKLGFSLGAWIGATSISAHDPIATEHPEWLVKGEDGIPFDSGQWYWEPHGPIHILDLTHPGAQEWLRGNIRSLARRGVRYIKGDFAGNVGSGAAKRRHDASIVGGGGTETGHIFAKIVRDALREADPSARYLSCGGPELPGPSQGDLIYTCEDTGNTGYVGWDHLRKEAEVVATHTFKNRKWGIIQPSCLCTGLPGTIDEARARATLAFLSGGQIDIGDDLTALPEDRWKVITATLPPEGRSARAIDLFKPVRRGIGSYATTGLDVPLSDMPEAPPGSVWALPFKTAWDQWIVAAVFSFDIPASKTPSLPTFYLPIDRLGLSPQADLDVYEFWSGQYCGCLPTDPPPPKSYTHPGDSQMPVRRISPEMLMASFYGPGVMLMAIRQRRPEPRVVGTGFHQSCGTELTDIRWDAATTTLSGAIRRPAGESGTVVFAGFHGPVSATVDGRPAATRPGARGSIVLQVTMAGDVATWEIAEA